MTVEIRELVIRAIARREPSEDGAREGDASEERTEGREAIVEACVRRVLEALERRKER